MKHVHRVFIADGKMGLHSGCHRHHQPIGIVKFRHLQWLAGSGEGRVTGKNPNQIIFFLDWVAAGLSAGEFLFFGKVGNVNAFTAAVLFPAMISTGQMTTLDFHLVQRFAFMRSSIL